MYRVGRLKETAYLAVHCQVVISFYSVLVLYLVVVAVFTMNYDVYILSVIDRSALSVDGAALLNDRSFQLFVSPATSPNTFQWQLIQHCRAAVGLRHRIVA